MQINRLAGTVFLAALMAGASAPHLAAQGTSPAMFDAVTESKKVIEQLGLGKFAEIEARFSPEMATALPAGQLATAWGQLTAQAGKLTELGEPRIEDRDGVRLVIFPATYANATLNLILAWSADHKLAGLLAQPRG